jgi:phage terminase large subunit-like protein
VPTASFSLEAIIAATVPIVESLAAEAARTREEATTTPGPIALSFRDFIEPAWRVIEPATAFVGGYHVDAIGEHLQAISDGQLQNLIINIPPRHSKSSLVCVLWPSWEWTFKPHLQWLFASYREALAIRDSVKMRRLITSHWYQTLWCDVFRLTGDQNEKRRYENDRAGYRVSMGVGTGTGEGGHRLVIDDGLSADQAESDAYRQAATDWVDSTFSTRGNDPRTVARVIVEQRLHEADTTGHLLKKMARGGTQYDHLVLPAEYEPTVQICLADLQHDRRTVDGAPLSPERYGLAQLEELKIDLGSESRIAGQLQQRPAPAGGLIFQREWWNGKNRYRWDDPSLPRKVVARYLSADTAYKDKRDNDLTAIITGELLDDYRLLVREIVMERVQFHDLIDFLKTTAVRWNADGKLQAVIVEEKGSGISALQQLRSAADPPWLSALMVGFEPGGSKEYRARKAALWPSRDMVLLPEPCPEVPWLLDFAGPEPHGNLFKFPNVAHDDDVDGFTQMIDYCWEILAQGWRARQGGAA